MILLGVDVEWFSCVGPLSCVSALIPGGAFVISFFASRCVACAMMFVESVTHFLEFIGSIGWLSVSML